MAPLVDLPCLTRPPTMSYWIVATQRQWEWMMMQKEGAMMSGFEITSVILTSCETHSVQCI